MAQRIGVPTETAVGENAQVHFANIDIEYENTTGLCSWNAQYSYYPDTGNLDTYSADAYVYLDNAEFGGINANARSRNRHSRGFSS